MARAPKGRPLPPLMWAAALLSALAQRCARALHELTRPYSTHGKHFVLPEGVQAQAGLHPGYGRPPHAPAAAGGFPGDAGVASGASGGPYYPAGQAPPMQMPRQHHGNYAHGHLPVFQQGHYSTASPPPYFHQQSPLFQGQKRGRHFEQSDAAQQFQAHNFAPPQMQPQPPPQQQWDLHQKELQLQRQVVHLQHQVQELQQERQTQPPQQPQYPQQLQQLPWQPQLPRHLAQQPQYPQLSQQYPQQPWLSHYAPQWPQQQEQQQSGRASLAGKGPHPSGAEALPSTAATPRRSVGRGSRKPRSRKRSAKKLVSRKEKPPAKRRRRAKLEKASKKPRTAPKDLARDLSLDLGLEDMFTDEVGDQEASLKPVDSLTGMAPEFRGAEFEAEDALDLKDDHLAHFFDTEDLGGPAAEESRLGSWRTPKDWETGAFQETNSQEQPQKQAMEAEQQPPKDLEQRRRQRKKVKAFEANEKVLLKWSPKECARVSGGKLPAEPCRILIDSSLQKGGYATVFKGYLQSASDDGTSLDLPVAVKQFIFEDTDILIKEALFFENFIQIAPQQALAFLSYEPERHFMVLELATIDMFDWMNVWVDMKRKPAMPLITGMMKRLLTGVMGMHRIGLAHRDLKPENMLFGCGGGKLEPGRRCELLISDFGLSCAAPHAPTVPEELRAYKCGPDVGTKSYWPPEMIHKDLGFDRNPFKQDIYSVGLILHMLLVRTAGGRVDLQELQRNPRRGPETIIASSKAARPDVDARLLKLLHRTLQVDPRKRCTALQCLAELDTEDPARTPSPEGTWEPAAKRRRVTPNDDGSEPRHARLETLPEPSLPLPMTHENFFSPMPIRPV